MEWSFCYVQFSKNNFYVPCSIRFVFICLVFFPPRQNLEAYFAEVMCPIFTLIARLLQLLEKRGKMQDLNQQGIIDKVHAPKVRELTHILYLLFGKSFEHLVIKENSFSLKKITRLGHHL